MLAEALVRFIGETEGKEKLDELDRAISILEPCFDPPIGNEIWLYVGLQRDADANMAKAYQKDILDSLHTLRPHTR